MEFFSNKARRTPGFNPRRPGVGRPLRKDRREIQSQAGPGGTWPGGGYGRLNLPVNGAIMIENWSAVLLETFYFHTNAHSTEIIIVWNRDGDCKVPAAAAASSLSKVRTFTVTAGAAHWQC